MLGAVPAALASASAPSVSVRIEGLNKTLLDASKVKPTAVSKTGHSCAANSAAGALSAATGGRWSGSWSTSYKDFEVTKISGETDNYSTTKSYWEFFVNGVPASLGVCSQKLKAGEQILFAAVGSTESPADPITVKGASGGPYTVDYVNSKGKSAPLKGATVTVWSSSKQTVDTVTTTAKGVAKLDVVTPGTYSVTITKKGYIRDETSFAVAA
jgi:hypothetical protein